MTKNKALKEKNAIINKLRQDQKKMIKAFKMACKAIDKCDRLLKKIKLLNKI